MHKAKNGMLETTLGDLIAAASEVAFEYSENDRDAYILAQLALVEMLKKTAHKIDLNRDFENLPSSAEVIH